MSSEALTRDFSKVTRIAPELGSIVRKIEDFLKSIPSMNHIEPRRLVRMHPGIDSLELVRALEIARDRKLVKRSWGVIAPTTRCHAQGYWDRLSRIPKVLYDTGDDRFRRSDGEFIVVYRHPDAEDPDRG